MFDYYQKTISVAISDTNVENENYVIDSLMNDGFVPISKEVDGDRFDDIAQDLKQQDKILIRILNFFQFKETFES